MPKIQKPLLNGDGEVRPLQRGDKVHISALRDAFPELAAYAEKRKVGRPRSLAPKKLQSFKLSPDIIDRIRNSGRGYNARVEAVLREALAEGRI